MYIFDATASDFSAALSSGGSSTTRFFASSSMTTATVSPARALAPLKSDGVRVDPADLAFLGPYPTSKLKRFGDFPIHLQPEAMPATMELPV